MNAVLQMSELPRGEPVDQAFWRGRSGRLYVMAAERASDFSLSDDAIYLIASGPAITWIGGAVDLVEDAASRTRFRLATSLACAVFRMPAPADSLERMTLIWDLEGGERVA